MSSNKNINDLIYEIYHNLSSGLLYTHTRTNYNTTKLIESMSSVYGLIDLLIEKGLIDIKELDKKKAIFADHLVKTFIESGISMIYQQPEYDKYDKGHEILFNCKEIHPVCKSICCKLPYALSHQDVKEGIVRWELGRPYLIAHDADGFCVHLDRQTLLCSVHAHRPYACRGFDCRDTSRWHIWEDFEKRILNPKFTDEINETVRRLYTIPEI